MNSLDEAIIEIIEENIKDIETSELEIAELYKKQEESTIDYISKLFIKLGKDGLLNYSEMLKYNRLQSFQNYLEEQVKSLIDKESSIVNGLLFLLFSQVYYKQAYTLEKFTKSKVKYRKWDKDEINNIVNFNWNGTSYMDRIKNNHISLVSKILTSFTQSLRKNESIDAIAKNVNKSMNIRYSHSKSLVETEAFRVITDSQEKSFVDSRIVEKLFFHATLDEKTTNFCREHHGLIYPIESLDRPMLPAHIHCRSIWLPILIEETSQKEYQEFATYDDWYEFNILD
ncbi:minor capsid protein [Niallia sp. 01092]|uniref:minor capsid protein n=1 Tax=Niallia sp. 01092 TaxID=3457759 RepID=UPI003FD2D8EF